MLEQVLIAGVFLCLFYGLIFTSVAPAWLFTLAMSICYLAGLVSTGELLDKASNTGLITLVLLLLLSVGLEKLSWLERLSAVLVSAGYRRSLLRLGIVTAVFSAFVNNTAVVATLANSVRSSRLHLPSRLLMPLSFAAILGGTMTLIGTSTNLIVSSFLEDVSGSGLSFFAFLPVGAAAVLVGLLVIIGFSGLLPGNPTDEVNVNEYLVEAEVATDSPLVGRSIADNGLRDLEALFLVEIVRGDHLISPVSPQEIIEAGDKLIFSGDISQVSLLEKFAGLKLFATEEGLLRGNLTEVILLPGATVEGKTIKESGFRSLFDAAVVGMRRGGKRLSGKLGGITLQAGDSLMLAVGADFSTRRNVDKNFLVVDQNGIRGRSGVLSGRDDKRGIVAGGCARRAWHGAADQGRGTAAGCHDRTGNRARRRACQALSLRTVAHHRVCADALPGALQHRRDDRALGAASQWFVRAGSLCRAGRGVSRHITDDRIDDQQCRCSAGLPHCLRSVPELWYRPVTLCHGGCFRGQRQLPDPLRLYDESHGAEPRRLYSRPLLPLRVALVDHLQHHCAGADPAVLPVHAADLKLAIRISPDLRCASGSQVFAAHISGVTAATRRAIAAQGEQFVDSTHTPPSGCTHSGRAVPRGRWGLLPDTPPLEG